MAVDERVRHEIQYRGVSLKFVLPSANDHISKTLLAGGFYEQTMLEALAPGLRPGDLVVDAGANVGNHTLFFAKVAGCRVEAFEAVPSTAQILEENVRLNGLSGSVRVHVVALGEKEGQAKIASFDPVNVGGTTLEVDRTGEIPVRRLDDVLDRRPVRLLKIDVEGMDLAVLKGAARILQEDRPWVVCEAGSQPAYDSIRDFMADLGYSPTAVYNATDSFLFLPSRSEGEFRELVGRAFEQMMGMQREERAVAARLAQAGRYSERIKHETLAEMESRLQALRMGRTDIEMDARNAELQAMLLAVPPVDGGDANLRQQLAIALERCEQVEMDRAVNAQTVASSERRLKTLSQDLQEARQALARERAHAQAQLADAESRAQQNKLEAATMLERMAQAKLAMEQLKLVSDRQADEIAAQATAHEQAMSVMRAEAAAAEKRVQAMASALTKQEGAVARRVRELAENQQVLEELQVKLTKQEGAIARRDRQLVESQHQLTKLQGMVARMERELSGKNQELSSKNRELSGAMRRLTDAMALSAVLEERAQAAEADRQLVQESLAFRMGSLVTSSMRSPKRLVALVWTLPALVAHELRRRRQPARMQD